MVGLVQHGRSRPGRGRPRPGPAGRSGGPEWPPRCRRRARTRAAAGCRTCHRRPARRRPQARASGVEHVADLDGQLAGGGEDDPRRRGRGSRPPASARCIGSPKARVLPDPVWARPSTSRPRQGVGDGGRLDRERLAMPDSAERATRAAGSPRAAKSPAALIAGVVADRVARAPVPSDAPEAPTAGALRPCRRLARSGRSRRSVAYLAGARALAAAPSGRASRPVRATTGRSGRRLLSGRGGAALARTWPAWRRWRDSRAARRRWTSGPGRAVSRATGGHEPDSLRGWVARAMIKRAGKRQATSAASRPGDSTSDPAAARERGPALSRGRCRSSAARTRSSSSSSTSLNASWCSIMPRCPQCGQPQRHGVGQQLHDPLRVLDRREHVVLAADHQRPAAVRSPAAPRTRRAQRRPDRSPRPPPAGSWPASR